MNELNSSKYLVGLVRVLQDYKLAVKRGMENRSTQCMAAIMMEWNFQTMAISCHARSVAPLTFFYSFYR